ncbi:transmembrane protein 26-like [Amphiura filiformis]|uniref:transmembrane protein 26-like n=1 Tax=Amphiura filiformis TaxID=82378 RepID=UPI003B21493E
MKTKAPRKASRASSTASEPGHGISCTNVSRGIFVRVCFLLHSLLYVWRVVDVSGNWQYWGLMGIQFIMLVEAFITLKFHKTGEWQWFTPCIFIYLCNVVPCVWFLEIELLEERLSFIEARNLTSCSPPDSDAEAWLTFYDISIPVTLTDEAWSLALQQVLLFFLIAGRWILPKHLTHEKLSTLLLINIGMAADIVEFLSEGVQSEGAKCNEMVIIIVLIIWSVSILQFPFHGDAKNLRRLSVVSTLTRGQKPVISWLPRCFNFEVWSIMSIIVMQDGPFLGMRIYLIYLYGISDQSLIFFSAKNLLVLLLQFYRLWALLCLEWDAEEGRYSLKLSRKINSIRRTVRNLGGRRYRGRGDSENPVAEIDTEADRENRFRVAESAEIQDDPETQENDYQSHQNTSYDAGTEDHQF